MLGRRGVKQLKRIINMTKLDVLQQELNNVKELADTIQKQIDNLKAGKLQFEIGKKYWIVEPSGAITALDFDNDHTDQNTVKMGGAYHTQAEAIKARDKQLATVRVLNKLRELEGDWCADWNDKIQAKCFFFYDPVTTKVGLDYRHDIIFMDPQFYSSETAWQWVIENMYADLKLMWDIE